MRAERWKNGKMPSPKQGKIEWVKPDALAPGDWMLDPHSGQLGQIESIEIGDGKVAVRYSEGPPGTLGFSVKADRLFGKLKGNGK